MSSRPSRAATGRELSICTICNDNKYLVNESFVRLFFSPLGLNSTVRVRSLDDNSSPLLYCIPSHALFRPIRSCKCVKSLQICFINVNFICKLLAFFPSQGLLMHHRILWNCYVHAWKNPSQQLYHYGCSIEQGPNKIVWEEFEKDNCKYRLGLWVVTHGFR